MPANVLRDCALVFLFFLVPANVFRASLHNKMQKIAFRLGFRAIRCRKHRYLFTVFYAHAHSKITSPWSPALQKKNRPTFQMLCHFCWGFLYLLHQNHPKPSRSAQGSEELGAKSLSHGWSKASAAVSRCARSFCSSAAMKARPSWLTSSQLRALLGTYHGESPCNPHKCTRLNLPLSGARNMYKAL